jgi:hypothetical protein
MVRFRRRVVIRGWLSSSLEQALVSMYSFKSRDNTIVLGYKIDIYSPFGLFAPGLKETGDRFFKMCKYNLGSMVVRCMLCYVHYVDHVCPYSKSPTSVFPSSSFSRYAFVHSIKHKHAFVLLQLLINPQITSIPA